MHAGLADSAQHASQRLGHRGILKRNAVGNLDHVLPEDAPRNADVLRVGSVVEEQILAQIRLALAAIETRITRRRIGRQYAHTRLHAAVHVLAGLFNHARKLVPEKRRRLNHARVISALPHLQISSTSQRHGDAHQHFVVADLGDIYGLVLKIFRPVQNRRVHMPTALPISAHSCLMTTFKVLSFGCAANSSASAICSNGKRWEINSRTGRRRSKTSAADSAWSSTDAL